jgi:hypothetical protein
MEGIIAPSVAIHRDQEGRDIFISVTIFLFRSVEYIFSHGLDRRSLYLRLFVGHRRYGSFCAVEEMLPLDL